MIKLFIRHKIFEWCINSIAERIGSNFSHDDSIVVGSRFSRIVLDDSVRYGSTLMHEYHNCTITNVYYGKYFGKRVYVYDFTDETGDTIMACPENDAQFFK